MKMKGAHHGAFDEAALSCGAKKRDSREPSATVESLLKLRERREAWIRCLDGKDPNSIGSQLRRMIWDAASFRVIDGAQRLATRAQADQPMVNPLWRTLLDRCFFESQALAVRRQLDQSGLNGRRGVFSLRSLINDMRIPEHRRLLTRRNLFAIAGIDMDLEQASEREDSEMRQNTSENPDADLVELSSCTWQIERLHGLMDDLCEVTAAARSADDVVADTVFTGLLRRLDGVGAFGERVTKWLAHAATPESRACLQDTSLPKIQDELAHAHEILCRCFALIDGCLLRWESYRFLLRPKFDVLEHMDAPIATAQALPALRRNWREYDDITTTWSNTPVSWATC